MTEIIVLVCLLRQQDDSGQTSASPVKKPRMDSDDEDVESALAAEITLLKSSKVKYKFQSVDTGVRNLIFINTTVHCPIFKIHSIMTFCHLNVSYSDY